MISRRFYRRSVEMTKRFNGVEHQKRQTVIQTTEKVKNPKHIKMNESKKFYTQQLHIFKQKLKKINKQLLIIGFLRLIVFLTTAFAVYHFFGTNKSLFLAAVIGIAVFLFLVSKYTNLQHKKQKIKALIKINKTEMQILNGDFSNLPLGKEFNNPQHEFSNDIDLFGKNSFFQQLNRTATKSGMQYLAKHLTENAISDILSKQQANKELANKVKWRQQFSATASLVNTETNSDEIVHFIQNHESFLPKIMHYLPSLFLGVSVLLFGLNYFQVLPFKITIIWLVLGLLISGKYVKKIQFLSSQISKAGDTFKQYFKLLQLIENEEFTSDLLQKKQREIKYDSKKASDILKELAKYIDALDQRNNILFALLGNGFALWDIKQTYKIEKWINTYKNQVNNWFEVIAFFDAHNSYGNYIFNHDQYVFPQLTNTEYTINAKALGHPLLPKEKRIDNDFSIADNHFYIVTGANMAGKSTFLRTVSLSIVMANVGLPVCANSFQYKPIKLITSMRTDDSLSEDTSYFFSELKRLKFIVDKIRQENYFIILDEILKGTNSHDKAIGSKKFVQKLVKSNATGIIATHDLSLCETANELKQVKNYYFDAQIIDNELYFDYSFKEGICQNMNASFLLNKMGIV